MVGEVCEYDELAGNYEKLDTVRITTSLSRTFHLPPLKSKSTPREHFCRMLKHTSPLLRRRYGTRTAGSRARDSSTRGFNMFASALAFCTGGAGVALYVGEENMFQTTAHLAWSDDEKRRQEALRRRQQQQNSSGGGGGSNKSHRGKPNDKVRRHPQHLRHPGTNPPTLVDELTEGVLIDVFFVDTQVPRHTDACG